jgi:hypothetical protein
VVRVLGYRSRGLEFDSRRYQIFWEVVGLERGTLSLTSTTEELLGRNGSDFGLENREYVHGDPLRWPRYILYVQKLALTTPTCGGRSVGIVRFWTKATEFCFCLILITKIRIKTEPMSMMHCKINVTFKIRLNVMVSDPGRNTVHHIAVLKKTVMTTSVHREYCRCWRMKAAYCIVTSTCLLDVSHNLCTFMAGCVFCCLK